MFNKRVNKNKDIIKMYSINNNNIVIIVIAITIASCGSTYSTCPAYSLENQNTSIRRLTGRR